MNFKTTGLMLAALVAFVIAYLVLVPRTGQDNLPTKAPATTGSVAAQPVIEPKLGDITKIEAKVDGEEWVFEKSADAAAGAAAWKMTKPLDLKVQGFDVDRIARQLTGLQYEVSLEPGSAGATSAAQAGLEPAGTTVTLTDSEGKSATVEIGKAASSSETYVRIPGQTRILIGNAALRNLLKPRAIEYRDPQLWNLAADKITKIEIVDRSAPSAPVEYRIVRDGSRWNLESPVVARATSKVDELVQAISRMRVTKWEDSRAERVVAYGLQPAALTVKVTLEEEVPVEEKTEEAKEGESPSDAPKEPAKPVKKLTVHELHVSALSPVGEDTKTYVRVGEEPSVASIMKTMTEKLKPVLNELRDMSVSQTDATLAARIEFNASGSTAALVKKPDGWYFDDPKGTPARADDVATTSLLQQIKDLKATAFVDESIEVLAAAGFNRPAAELKVHVAGTDDVERILIGGFSDSQTKRLRYVRRNESKSIAKVKADDVAALLAGPKALRDRTILSLPVEAINQLAFSVRNPCLDGNLDYTLSRGDEGWSLTNPIKRPVQVDRVEAFVGSLKSLSATAVVGDAKELSAFGLDEPSATVTISFGKDDTKQSVVLVAAVHDGKHFAQRSDLPTVFEISADTYQSLLTEFRPAEVLRFDAPQVKRFTISTDEQTHSFERLGPKWVYSAEHDLPLDTKKVENLLLQLNDLKTERVVSFGESDLDGLDFATARDNITIELEDGTKKQLLISKKRCVEGNISARYARANYSPEVFLLTEEMAARFKVNIAELE